MQAVLGRAIGRTAGFCCGIFLTLVGLGLLVVFSDAGMSPADRPLIWVVVALGIGVIAASALPNSMTVSGEQLKPLGLNLNATGGAAFFIVTLVFVFYAIDKVGADETARIDPPSPVVAPTEVVSTSPSSEPAPVIPASAESTTLDPKQAAAPTMLPSPAPVESVPDVAQYQQPEVAEYDYDQQDLEAAMALGILATMAAAE